MSVDSIPFVGILSILGVCFAVSLLAAMRAILEWGLAPLAGENEGGEAKKRLFDYTQLCFLALVLVTAVAVLAVPPYNASNLGISDSVEYAIGAERAVRQGTYSLSIDDREFPPRYAPWFSLFALAPSYLFVGFDVGNAILPITLFALCGVIAAYCLGRRLSSTWGGMIAAFALLLDPGYRYFSGFPMTDVPGAALALVIVGYIMALRAQPRKEGLEWVALGLLVAMAAAWRPSAFVMTLLLVGACLSAKGWKERGKRLVLCFSPVILFLGMSAAYNLVTFGSVFRNGYQFWLPWPYQFPSVVFSVRYVSENLKTLLFHTPFTLCAVIVVASWPLMKPGTLGIHKADYYSLLKIIGFVGVPLVVFYGLYFYSTSRFFLPLAVLMYVAIGATIGGFLKSLDAQRLVTLLLLVSVAAASVGWRASKEFPAPTRRIAAENIAAHTPPDAVIVSGLDPVYVEPFVLRTSKRTFIPYSRKVEFASKVVAWDALEFTEPYPQDPHQVPRDYVLLHGGKDAVGGVARDNPELVQAALDQGRSVFLETSALEPYEVELFSRQFLMNSVALNLFAITKPWKSGVTE